MTLSSALHAAEEMGVPPKQAVMARLRFLMPRISELENGVFVCQKRAAKAATERVRTGYEAFACFTMKELEPLKSEAKVLVSYINGKIDLKAQAGRVSHEMIEQAMRYPIARLLGLEPNKVPGNLVCCPFHEDSQPSASIKTNQLICFAGCKPKNGKNGWNTITLLMERDGLSFPAAVRALQ